MQRQARAPRTRAFGMEALEGGDGTVLRWLGMAGFLINSRGTTVMVDPLLGWFDMPVLIEFPIASAEVPRLDAVLVTHSDNDHYSVPTCRELAGMTGEYHSTQYVPDGTVLIKLKAALDLIPQLIPELPFTTRPRG